MPRQRAEPTLRQDRHNPMGTPQARSRTDSSASKANSNLTNNSPHSSLASSHYSPAQSSVDLSPFSTNSNCRQLDQQDSQYHQQHQHHPNQINYGTYSPSSAPSVVLDQTNPVYQPAMLNRMVEHRGQSNQNQRQRTNTNASIHSTSSHNGFPDRDDFLEVQEAYSSKVQLRRDRSLVTAAMYNGTLYHLCLGLNMDAVAEQIRLDNEGNGEEHWDAVGVGKLAKGYFKLQRIGNVDENSSQKEKSERHFLRMSGCPLEGWALVSAKEGKAVVSPDRLFDVLSWCHSRSGHGGRDKTHGLLRKYFANVPKELCQAFVKTCPTCGSKRATNLSRVRGEEEDFGMDEDEMDDQDGDEEDGVAFQPISVLRRGTAGSSHHENGMDIDEWNSNAAQHHYNQAPNSLGLEGGVPTMAFMPPSPFHSQSSVQQHVFPKGRPSVFQAPAHVQQYDSLAPSFFGQTEGASQEQEIHRGSFSGSSASGLISGYGSSSGSTGPNTPASQMDLNWPKVSDQAFGGPYFGKDAESKTGTDDSGSYYGQDAMGPPPAPPSTTSFNFQGSDPVHESFSSVNISKAAINRANKPAQLDFSSINTQVESLVSNYQEYGFPTAGSSISAVSEASIYSAVTEPSIQHRPLLEGSDDEKGRTSLSELLPRRFDINNPPSSAPPAQTCFFSNPNDTLREMQEHLSRERAALSIAAASGKGKHASLNRGVGEYGDNNEDHLPSHRVATPLSAVPPTTTASFGPTYGAVFGNVVGGSGNLFRGQGRGKEARIESDLMPVTAYGAPDLTIYLNPGYGIPGMSGESMVKSFSAPVPSLESGRQVQEGSSQTNTSFGQPGSNSYLRSGNSSSIPAPPDLLRRHSVAVEQAVVPETNSSLVSLGMNHEAGFPQRPISTAHPLSPVGPNEAQVQQIQKALAEGDHFGNGKAKEGGHGRERARHESFDPLSTASSPTDIKEIAKLNGMTKSYSTDGSLNYDTSITQTPAELIAQFNRNMGLDLTLPRGIDSPSAELHESGSEQSIHDDEILNSLRNVWQAGTDSTASMLAKAAESFMDKASSIGIGLGFPSMGANDGPSAENDTSVDGDSSRGTIRVLRNASNASTQGRTSSGFQPARTRCSSTTKLDKSDVQVEMNGSTFADSSSKNGSSSTHSPAYGSMRSHSRRISCKLQPAGGTDENWNADLLDPNDLMSSEQLDRLLS